MRRGPVHGIVIVSGTHAEFPELQMRWTGELYPRRRAAVRAKDRPLPGTARSIIAAMALVIAVMLVVAGLAGIVLPGIPGTALIFAGLWLAAWSDHFVRVGVSTIIVLAVIAAATYVVEMAMMALGMKRLGTSRRAMAGAAIGTLAGLFFGLPGLIVGPFAGAVAGELTAHRDLSRAGRAGIAAWIGFAIGTVVKVGFAFVMIGIFLAAWFVF
jgi:uncharacterized protein YqgC (DUF456 family)